MRVLLASIGLLAAVSSAQALNSPPQPGPLAVKLVETYLLPRYQAFQSATDDQSKTWDEACKDGDFAPEAAALREKYQSAADAWAAVEHITTGPISVGLRSDRVFFTPDRRNYVAKSIAELEKKAADGDISIETIRGVSVAGQGFPALERVLFEDSTSEPKIRCRVAVAIAENLAAIATDVVREWTADGGPLSRLKDGKGDPVHFADPAQAAARLMTDLAGGFQRVDDVKLLPVLGSGPDAARPKAAEGWRSGRSARTIRAAVASLVAQQKVFAEFAPKDIAASGAKVFTAADAAVKKLPDDLGDAAADPKRRKTLEAAVAALKAAQNDLVKNLAPALGVPLGFNALDGD